MSTLISIRINNTLLQTMKVNAHRLRLSQTDYIRKAIEHMNNELAQQAKRSQLANASQRVRKNSLVINAEFSEIEHDPAA